MSEPLISSKEANRKIFQTGVSCASSVFLMTILLYVLAPSETIKHLSKTEKDGARIAFCMMLLVTSSLLIKFLLPTLQKKTVQPRDQISPVVATSLMILCCALFINGLHAFAPVVTMLDPVLGVNIYMVRWCEWIPLSGLMTYMSDIVSVPRREGGFWPTIMGWSQSISCLPVIFFPFATNLVVWWFGMIVACLFYLFMFPRLWYKYKVFKETPFGTSHVQVARRDRHKFGLHLFAVCTAVWTLLVILFFCDAAFKAYLPSDHLLRHEATQILTDCTFDVIAKAFYARLILDVHIAVFAYDDDEEKD